MLPRHVTPRELAFANKRGYLRMCTFQSNRILMFTTLYLVVIQILRYFYAIKNNFLLETFSNIL